MKTKIFSFLMILFFAIPSNAQEIERFVIGSAGSVLSEDNIEVHNTIGECVIKTVISGSIKVLQGYHQPLNEEVEIISSNGEVHQWLNYEVYPNPTSDRLHFQLTGDEDAGWTWAIWNTEGKRMSGGFITMNELVTTDVEFWPSSHYVLILENPKKQISETITFIKQ